MAGVKVHVGVDGTLRSMPPLSFHGARWNQHRVADHDDVAIVVLMKEYNVYRRHDFPEEEYWSITTGLYRILIDGQTHIGNRAFCFAKLDEYRGRNPRGLSEEVLAVIDEFLKTKEATDGRQGIP
jgi:hypothetical protein